MIRRLLSALNFNRGQRGRHDELLTRIGAMQAALGESKERLDLMDRWNFRLSEQLNLLLARQSARPYYPLGGKWGLTQLSTGQPFYIDRNARDLSPWILLGGTWETFIDDLLCALVRPGGCFVDVGANLGYYTIKVGGIVGAHGRVFAFEPNPAVFEILKENVTLNALGASVSVFNAAAGAGPGHLEFGFEPSHPGGGSVYPPGHTPPAHTSASSVPIVSIDDSLPGDCVVDLIKIDVEGFEPMVFDGMARTLARSPAAAIVTEFNYAGWSRFGDPLEMLLRYAGDRRLFRVFEDGHLQEMTEADFAGSLQGDFVAYFLMQPRTSAAGRPGADYVERCALKAA
jgi:FkbM family methyltransferase